MLKIHTNHALKIYTLKYVNNEKTMESKHSVAVINHKKKEIMLFQTSEKNPSFSTMGNGQFGNVLRTGWKPSRLGEAKKQIIVKALSDSDVSEVYQRGNKVFAFLLNGTEKRIV